MIYEDDIKKLKTELKKKELEIAKLKNLVSRDELTGVYNRRGFKEEINRIFNDIAFARANPETRKHFYIAHLSLLFFDIDNFKKINDTYGHKTGDHVLQYVTGVISKKVRSIDMVGRWGGEEIAVALIGSDAENAYRKAEEIRKAIKQRVRIPSKDMVPITVSIGVAQIINGMNLDELVKAADSAMYKAKKTGKNKTIRFDENEKIMLK